MAWCMNDQEVSGSKAGRLIPGITVLKMALHQISKLSAQDGSPGIDNSRMFSHMYVTRSCYQAAYSDMCKVRCVHQGALVRPLTRSTPFNQHSHSQRGNWFPGRRTIGSFTGTHPPLCRTTRRDRPPGPSKGESGESQSQQLPGNLCSGWAVDETSLRKPPTPD